MQRNPVTPEGFVKLEPIREMLFATKLLTETRLIVFCLGVQYADFLEPLQNLANTALALRARAAGSLSSSQQQQTGSSTGSQPASGTATA